MRFILLTFKYFDEAFCALVMLERPAQSLAYFFFMIDCERGKGEEKKKEKINGCELVRMWVNASETRDVEFRCMVTDGKPCRNQKIVFIFLWFCSGNIRCKWNPYYRMDGLGNKDKHRLKFAFPSATSFFFLFFCVCENEYCRLLHPFVFSTFVSGSRKLQRSRLQTIICQTWRRSGKKQSLFTLDQRYQSHMKNEQSEKNKNKKFLRSHTHTREHTKRHHFGIYLLSEMFDPNCNMSQEPGPSTT